MSLKGSEFNLLEEPWIRVMSPDCAVREVSLTEALLHAHEFTDLAGEMPTQDVAILRLMLAVLHSVFSRVDERGEPSPLEEADEALDRWEAIWEAGRLPEKPVAAYLNDWRDRFWLFHPDRPFWQVPEAKKGTRYTAAKLNGTLSESSNKLRLFPALAAEEKSCMTYAEAARWLLHVNGFDDTSSKPKGKDLPSPGAGWLGKLGLIEAHGDSLFETLMLNLVLLNDNGEPWGAAQPVWERPVSRTGERTEITVPDNQAELLTLQSRRLLLEREGRSVCGYELLGGDFFPKANAFAEQMTVWSGIPEKSPGAPGYQPRRHDAARQMWREFPAIFISAEGRRLPGVVRWSGYLKEAECLDEKQMISFRNVSAQYGDKDFYITDVFQDELTFHTAMLSEMGIAWRRRVEDEIERCGKLASEVGWLAVQLDRAAGGETDTGEEAKEQFYARIDAPFRRWLIGLDPASGDGALPERQREWQGTARNVAVSLGKELTDAAGYQAFVGRSRAEKVKGKDTERHYSAPEAFNWFLKNVKKIFE